MTGRWGLQGAKRLGNMTEKGTFPGKFISVQLPDQDGIELKSLRVAAIASSAL